MQDRDDLGPWERTQVRHLVGALHAGTADATVYRDVRRRAQRAGAGPRLARAFARYAVAEHRDARALYAQVTSGRIACSRG